MRESELYAAAVEIQAYSALLLKFFNQALEQRLREYGETLSSLQYGMLNMLQFETLTISEIGQRLGMDLSTLTRSVDALERKGLAERGKDPHDRRRNPIHITPKGRELMAAVPVIAPQDLTFQALCALGPEKAAETRDRLRELVRQFPEGALILDSVSDRTT